MDAQNYIRCVCEGCNTEFEAVRPKRYCTRKCNKAAIRKNKTSVSRAEYVANMRENAASKFTCECCGIEAFRTMSGTNKAKGYENKYCSMACRVATRYKVRSECSFLSSLANAPRKIASEAESKQAAVRRLAKALGTYTSYRTKADRRCLVCGCKVGYTFGKPKEFCSKACYRKTEAFRSSKKVAKLKRKAMKRGANGGEYVNPIKVFMAAGWKCQICNKPTPQRLRGSVHKRAPELDHVIPLSKGGSHTLANVQCACRECNLWKSDKIVVGQANLFL